MRTYSRDSWNDAQYLWSSGDFSDEWKPWRHEAAMAGIIYPPEGTKWDSWEDDSPSQRAMLIRAIRESPALLHRCIPGAHSWSDVLERLLRSRDDWREEMRLAERVYPDERPRDISAPMSIARILERIKDSVGA